MKRLLGALILGSVVFGAIYGPTTSLSVPSKSLCIGTAGCHSEPLGVGSSAATRVTVSVARSLEVMVDGQPDLGSGGSAKVPDLVRSNGHTGYTRTQSAAYRVPPDRGVQGRSTLVFVYTISANY